MDFNTVQIQKIGRYTCMMDSVATAMQGAM